MADIPWKTIAVVGGATLGAMGLVALAAGGRRRLGERRSQRFALIGDSYAVGLGPELAKLLPGFDYEGHSGIRTDQWVGRTEQCYLNRGPGYDHGHGCGAWLASYKPDVVLVSLGVNDGDSIDPANYQTIVRTLHGIGARVVWIEPPLGVTAPTLAQRQIIRSLGVQVVPATHTETDGLHPLVYGPWAGEVAQALQKAGHVA